MSWLEGALTTAAFLWRIERRDGVTQGFTSHDRDIVLNGLIHRAAPGMLPSAIALTDDLDPGGLEVSGALGGASIAAADLAAGRYDGARVSIALADWSGGGGAVTLCTGDIGEVTATRGRFTADLRGPAARLDGPATERTSPECRAELGDRRCRVDMAGRRHGARLVAVEDAAGRVLRFDRDEGVPDAFGWGWLRWLSGDNAGSGAAIRRSAGATLWLRDRPHAPPRAGDRAELIEGCDKRLESCAARFGNAVNFRGEPHLPGNDLLTRTPGGG